MSIGVELDRGDVIRFTGRVDELVANIADLDRAGAWQAVSNILSEEFEALFDAEGGRGGPRWSRLSPVTVELRQKRNHTPIRVGWASGRMAQSLIEPTAAGAVEIRAPKEFVRGTAIGKRTLKGGFVGYPTIFEEGRKGQPPRPIMGRLFRKGNTRVLSRIGEAVLSAIVEPNG